MAVFIAPEGGIFAGDDNTEQVTATLSDQADRIATLEQGTGELGTQLEETRAGIPDEAALTQQIDAVRTDLAGRLDDMSSRIDGLSDDLSRLAGRVTDLEKRPISERDQISDAVAAYESELEETRQALADQRAKTQAATDRIAARAEEAQAAIDEASRQAQGLRQNSALTRIEAAIESGAPFAQALGSLGDIDVPQALSSVAESGTPTLAELERSFPAAAREALDAARESGSSGSTGERIETFLRSQVGARSLEPRSGDSPDAILSRAEAALDSGDVDAALDELSALPDPGREAMSDWLASARSRIQARDAARKLVQQLGQG